MTLTVHVGLGRSRLFRDAPAGSDVTSLRLNDDDDIADADVDDGGEFSFESAS